MIRISLFILLLLLLACAKKETSTALPSEPFLMVLGTAQDAGFPQAACQKACCRPVWQGEKAREWVSCLAYVDPKSDQAWLFDATPDFKDQLYYLQEKLGVSLAGIFLTHAHMGHYTGLMHLGREAMGAAGVPVYVMPEMYNYLSENGPWSQLQELGNIELIKIQADSLIRPSSGLAVLAMRVPHRDEFSETVGYSIRGGNKKALFIPDIDKWQLWERSIDSVSQQHDWSFLDGSFFANGEIPGRDMSEIPHPFVQESLQRWQGLPANEKARIHFIHFNHTNPLLYPESEQSQRVLQQGFGIARTGAVFPL
ncbi:MAG TPA: MBL fold metallo-hydrolase [Saprospiraceae bacterium]|nr:MBL fold metallo-hydrolase [Saprospiraceae bacterium]